jgi:DNA polymerase V
MPLHFIPWPVSAGFPSPGERHFEQPLDLDALLSFERDATYYVTVEGNSMIGAAIHDGDILIVSRAVEPTSRAIIVAVLNNTFTVKRLMYGSDGAIFLHSEHPHYPPLHVEQQMNFSIWGVVMFVLHPLHPLSARRLHQREGNGL